MYKKARSQFWTAEEIDLSDDQKHWENLNSGERISYRTYWHFLPPAMVL
jgi:ribonucleotide reductase beta subunit family protein with ferritin-like domain